MDEREARRRIVALWLGELQPDDNVRDIASAWVLAQGDIEALIIPIMHIPAEKHASRLQPVFQRLKPLFADHQKWASDS